MTVLRNTEVTGDRQEHERVFARESPLVDQQFGGFLTGVLESFVQIADRRAVGEERIGRLGDGPTSRFAFDHVDLYDPDAAYLDTGPRDLAVTHRRVHVADRQLRAAL